MHDWSETSFDWESLDKAGNYISKRSRQFGRVGIHTKEKFGTLRVSTMCAYLSEYDCIYHLCYPGRYYYHWPVWFRQYIDWPIGKVLEWAGVLPLVRMYQRAVLKFFWKRAAKKWSHISKEILDEYDWEME